METHHLAAWKHTLLETGQKSDIDKEVYVKVKS
jgi:hypothetical protein